MCNDFNHIYQRTGRLWEGRIKPPLISEQYAEFYRYIKMNPVRAEMVKHPAEYPWSSYRVNTLGKHDNLVYSTLFIKP
ncbi:MAG: hypothetical protein D3923_09570 [Candidatus Electrothrix sp. AR3]|nr:hypothetical protein [Candidatus Electrothrix sp. AR3]